MFKQGTRINDFITNVCHPYGNLSQCTPLTISVTLFVCPLNILTTLLISMSMIWISKSSKETASKELQNTTKRRLLFKNSDSRSGIQKPDDDDDGLDERATDVSFLHYWWEKGSEVSLYMRRWLPLSIHLLVPPRNRIK